MIDDKYMKVPYQRARLRVSTVFLLHLFSRLLLLERVMRYLRELCDLGTVQNLSYDMAGGDEISLEKNLLAPYEIIAEKLTVPSPFP